LTYEDVRASALTQDDLDDGVRGINASLDLIRRTRGGWPTAAVTAADNYVDPVWHQFEFRESYSFAYVVRRDHGRYLGCCYLYPMGRRVALTGLAAGTVRGYVSHARRFVDERSSIGALAQVTAAEVTEAVLHESTVVSVGCAAHYAAMGVAAVAWSAEDRTAARKERDD
jgi:hypothetical protein